MALFKTKKEKEREKQDAIARKVTTLQQPGSTIDKKYRPLKEKRTQYGYRGYDPSREPLVGPSEKARGKQIKERLGVTPADLKRKVEAEKKKKAVKKK